MLRIINISSQNFKIVSLGDLQEKRYQIWSGHPRVVEMTAYFDCALQLRSGQAQYKSRLREGDRSEARNAPLN